MRAEDAEAVVEMARELAAEVADPDPCLDAAELIRNGCGPERWFDCFVAEVKGELAGYALTCRGYEAHAGKRRLWLGDLYVRPDARGSGIGRALIAALARHALELHCDAIYWELWRPNRAGRAFYQTFGAIESGNLAVLRLDGPRLAIAARQERDFGPLRRA